MFARCNNNSVSNEESEAVKDGTPRTPPCIKIPYQIAPSLRSR